MICAVILAAGQSSRLGQPKQLIAFRGQTLIARAVHSALNSHADQVVVVTGADSNAIEEEISDLSVTTVYNAGWQTGKASSIHTGINATIELDNNVEAILFMTCDQPRVTTDLLNQIVDRYRSGDNNPVACQYAGTIGIPALIPRRLFPKLMILQGDSGAREVLLAHAEEVRTIPFENCVLDIDTEEDLQKLFSDNENMT
jgi:molybdenum cofactor cytidylyltransferase